MASQILCLRLFLYLLYFHESVGQEGAAAVNKAGERIAVLFLDQLLKRGQELFIKKTYKNQLEYLEEVNPEQADHFKKLPVDNIVKEAAFARDATAALSSTTGNSYLDLLAKYGIAIAPPKSSAPKVDDNPVKAVAKQVVKRIFQSVSSALTPKEGIREISNENKSGQGQPLNYSRHNWTRRRPNARRAKQRFYNHTLTKTDSESAVHHLFTEPDRLRVGGERGFGRKIFADNLIARPYASSRIPKSQIQAFKMPTKSRLPGLPWKAAFNSGSTTTISPSSTSTSSTPITTLPAPSPQPPTTLFPETIRGYADKNAFNQNVDSLHANQPVDSDRAVEDFEYKKDDDDPVDLQYAIAQRIKAINRRASLILARRERNKNELLAKSLPLPLPTLPSTTPLPVYTTPALPRLFIRNFQKDFTNQSRQFPKLGQQGQPVRVTLQPQLIKTHYSGVLTPNQYDINNDRLSTITDDILSTYTKKYAHIRAQPSITSSLASSRRTRKLNWLDWWTQRPNKLQSLIRPRNAPRAYSSSLIKSAPITVPRRQGFVTPPAPVPYSLRQRVFWSRDPSTRIQVQPRAKPRASALLSSRTKNYAQKPSGQTRFKIRNRLSKYDQHGGRLNIPISPLESRTPVGNLGTANQKADGSETEIRWPKNWLSGATFGATHRNVYQRTNANSGRFGLSAYNSPFLIG